MIEGKKIERNESMYTEAFAHQYGLGNKAGQTLTLKLLFWLMN
jgi:hypothetical protein